MTEKPHTTENDPFIQGFELIHLGYDAINVGMNDEAQEIGLMCKVDEEQAVFIIPIPKDVALNMAKRIFLLCGASSDEPGR